MLGNWIRETTTTTGTGNLTVSSVSGYPTINTLFPVNERFYYSILDDSTGAPIECGIGYLSASTTLVRERPVASMVSGTYDATAVSAVSLASGTKRVIVAALSQSFMPALPYAGAITGTGKHVGSGNVFASQSAGTSNCIDTSGRLNLWPFLLTYGGEFDAFVVQVSTAQADKIMRIGLYGTKGSNGQPSDLIVEGSTTVDLGSTGVKTTTFTSRVLAPGWYYMAEVADATSVVCVAPTQTTQNSMFLPAPWGPLDRDCGVAAYALSVSTSAMPATVPALSTTVNLRPPTIQLRAV